MNMYVLRKRKFVLFDADNDDALWNYDSKFGGGYLIVLF